jgi:hypothetical protein
LPPTACVHLKSGRGLDIEDHRDWTAKCLVTLERFTGLGITEADIERVPTADVGYRRSPWTVRRGRGPQYR